VASAILLAAGESTRMGRPKVLLPWAGTTLLAYQARELHAAGIEDVLIVLGHEARVGTAEIARFRLPQETRIVVNEAYREGRASSLRAGARVLSDAADPIVILGVDQPRPAAVTRALLEAHARGGGSITLPAFEGHRGHPVVLADALLPELREATDEAQGLRGVIAAHEAEVREVAFETAQVLLDLNTPEEYEAAFAQYGS
jgi:molybdenum cofactor cytidylyltransferase